MSRLSGRAVQDEGGLRRTHVNDLLRIAVEHGASDLHLKVGSYPMMRVRGDLVPAANDRRLAFRLEAIRTLSKQTQVSLRYEHERNASPIDLYDYERNWLAVSIEIWR